MSFVFKELQNKLSKNLTLRIITMKIILFDLIATQPDADVSFHGGGKYTKKVFLEMLRYKRINEWIVYGVYNSLEPIDDEIIKSASVSNIKLIDIKSDSLPNIIHRLKINRLYTALPFGLLNYGFYEVVKSKCEIYVTIHGLRTLETAIPFEALKYTFSFKEKIRLVLKITFEKMLFKRDLDRYSFLLDNTNILAVSNHTKYSLMSFYPQMNNDIKVYYSPDVTGFADESSEINEENLTNYFLMVSGNRWLKNNIRSAIALDELFTERPNISQNVIIIGVNNPGIYLKRLKNKDRFIFYQYVNEGTLSQLYKNAYAFIYMSLNEGFGYPPLEAMRFGIPVITNSFTSISEICGDAALYCNPYSIVEIKNRVLNLIDEHNYNSLTKKSYERYNLVKLKQDIDLQELVDYILD